MPNTTILTQLSIPKVNAGAVGDTFLLADGTYDHPSREAITKGVIFKAQNPRKAIIRGAPIDLNGTGAKMDGFDLQYSMNEDYIRIEKPSSLLNNKIHFANKTTQKWIVVNDPDVTIAGNEIYNKTTVDDIITVNDVGVKIQNNHFHDQTQSVTDTRTECIRLGASSVATKDFHSDVSGNIFENIAADVELITVKSCNNSIHDNTFRNCKSSPTFRHGRNNKFQHNKLEGVGLRIYGKGHVITGNDFKLNPNARQLLQIVVGNAEYKEEEDNTTAGYTQVRDMLFEDNHIDMADSNDLIILCWGYDSRSLTPVNNRVINNTITASKGTLANTSHGASWTNNTISGNVFWATGTAKYGDMPTSGYIKKDPNAPIPVPPEPEPEPPVALTLEQRVALLEAQVKKLNEVCPGMTA